MKYCISFLFFITVNFAFGQNFEHLNDVQPDSLYENIYVKKLDSDSFVSNFLIWVKKDVKLHEHRNHCETIIVLEGRAVMFLGGKKIKIKKGDYIFIPRNTPHSVFVHSKKPLKVLSVQAPEFKGEDRFFIVE